MNVGVLALQGDFDAHARALERAGVGAFAVPAWRVGAAVVVRSCIHTPASQCVAP